MTDPIDESGDDRDDDFGWERRDRDEDRGSTADQLARLRDGLARGVGRSSPRRPASGGSLRADAMKSDAMKSDAMKSDAMKSDAKSRRREPGEPERDAGRRGRSLDLGEAEPRGAAAAGRGLPGSIDRAIDRVGDLFDDLGPASPGDGVRDPYAAPSAEPYEPYEAQDPYAAPVEDAYTRQEPVRRRGAGRGLDADLTEERLSGGRPDRRARRAARAQKAAGYDGDRSDQAFDPGPDAWSDRDEAAERDPYAGRDYPDRDRSRGPRDASFDDAPFSGGQTGAFDDEPGFGQEREPSFAPSAEDEGYGRGRHAGADRVGRGSERQDARARGYDDDAERRRAPRGRQRERDWDREHEYEHEHEHERERPAPPAPDLDPAEAHATALASRGRGSAPFGSLERLLAGRYLRARRKEGFISVIAMLSLIGITLAVAVLIVVMSVMNGFRAELIDKIVGVNGHLIVTPIERSFDSYEDVARSVRTVPGVTRAAPMIEGQAFATSSRSGVGVMVRGLSKSDLLSLERISVKPEDSVGSLASYGEGDGIAIGAGLARRLGVTVGDTISIISPQGSVTPFGVAPKRRAHDIVYVFKMGMSNYDDVLLFMPIDRAQSFFNRQGAADFIEVKVATPDRLDGYREDIEIAAGRPVAVTTWQESNGVFIGALETEQAVMFLILSMLILIASLIIISGLIMLVKEKGQDIAILRTMGLSRGGVMRVFFMCGATIGVVGATVGVLLGVVVALNVNDIKEFIEANTGARLFPSEVYLFSSLPSRLDWGDVGFTILITLGLSFLATLYPAWRAAQMDPVEALRYE